jgi:hypothetical protein
MVKIGSIVYGSWKDGSDIFKDAKGYYIIQWDPKSGTEYQKYLKGWKPSRVNEVVHRRTKRKTLKKRHK